MTRGPAPRALLTIALAVALEIAPAPRVWAQRTDSARVGPSAVPRADTLPTSLTTASPKPPITPTHALLQSLVLPGWGQASLDRGTAGAIFVSVEALSVAMLIQSKSELHAAQRVAHDSVWDATQSIYVQNPYQQVIGARQQAVEDWTVLIIFNHLLAAADAFVAAHLWNVPIEVGGSPSHKQAVIGTHLPW